jgi:outer membrane receptor protein involved in Fe transport
MFSAALWLTLGLLGCISVFAQGLGSAGTITVTVVDPNGAVVPGATVTISNPVTNFTRTVKTDTDGAFTINNVPPNNYQLTVSAQGFSTAQQNLTVRTSVPIGLKIPLSLAGASAEVTVSDTNASAVLENVPSTHTDVDQSQIKRLPLTGTGTELSEAVTLTAPGVVADSNGFFHPLGDHAESTLVLDNQPIPDQQSKAFSNQIPVEAIQSMELVTGSAPAEFGDKTSLVINATTRSGLNQKKPTGSFSTLYGTFGTSSTNGTLAFGSNRIGNFTAVDIDRSGRFLDAPEFQPLHDIGNSARIFNRTDYQLGPSDTLHFNLFLARTNYQVANTFDQQAAGQDQRNLLKSINIAPGYVHIFSPTTVLSVNPFYRLDQVKYSPSANPFSDQPATLSQQRRLTNAGIRGDLSWVKGRNNAKFGVNFVHYFLSEAFQFGITDPNFNPVCLDADGNPVSATTCNGTTTFPNPGFLPGLLPFDLTRGGQEFQFRGHTDIKQVAFFGQDLFSLTKNLTLNLGLRYDIYRGLSRANLLQPRVGVSYLFQPTKTVLRASFTRNMETPYNENLILSSTAGEGGLGNGILGEATQATLLPGTRNQYNVGFQQAVGKRVIIDGDYFYKLTHNAYDFNVILNTPITFPIAWNKSKIDGVSFRVNFTDYKGFTAFFVAGHTRARFFPPETGGLFFNSDLPTGVFRIDHDQAFQQTTQLQYQFKQWKHVAPYVTFTWRYDSGLVSGAVPGYATALTFTPDQQQQIGLFCGSTFATLTQPITSCSSPNRGALRIRIPADGTENDDTNPPRIAPRHLFDLGVGTDNLFRTERTKVTARFAVLNLTNKDALFNFESTFSGTHFVPPRTFQGQIGITF